VDRSKEEEDQAEQEGEPAVGTWMLLSTMLQGRIFIEQGTGDGFDVLFVGNSYGIQVPANFNSGDPVFANAVYEHIAFIGKKEAKIAITRSVEPNVPKRMTCPTPELRCEE
jgi:hypothetical protein